jgi:hypothetical protein
MFGARRSTVYGATVALKSKPLTAAATDQVRETHANELMARLVRPRIMDEEFPDYQKRFDTAEIEPTPLTLPCFPATIPVPAFSGQKRSGGALEEDDYADSRAFGSGARPAHHPPTLGTPEVPLHHPPLGTGGYRIPYMGRGPRGLLSGTITTGARPIAHGLHLDPSGLPR